MRAGRRRHDSGALDRGCQRSGRDEIDRRRNRWPHRSWQERARPGADCSDPDRLKEEKARGITIDLGFAHCRLDDLNIAFVDVPGHERFVRNMLAGASGVDCVLLVVAADESVMPQTREHFDICRLLQVRRGVVALTKCDLVDAETVELVRLEVGHLVDDSFLAGAPVIPVSAKDGTGLDDLREALSEVARMVEARSLTGTARLPVDRAFYGQGIRHRRHRDADVRQDRREHGAGCVAVRPPGEGARAASSRGIPGGRRARTACGGQPGGSGGGRARTW